LLALGLATIAVSGGRSGQGLAVVLAVLTGLTIATYSVVDAGAVRQVSPAGYLGAVMAVQGLVITLSLRGRRLRLRRGLRSGILIALGSVAAYLLVLLAFQHAPAGRVSTLRESSVVIGLLISGEQPSPAVWAGALLVLAGAILAAS
jgi:drug/metabolite transporter (DMT)-like permease